MDKQELEVQIIIGAQVILASAIEIPMERVAASLIFLISEASSSYADLDRDEVDVTFSENWERTTLNNPEDYDLDELYDLDALTAFFWKGDVQVTLDFSIEVSSNLDPDTVLKDINLGWDGLESNDSELIVIDSEEKVVEERIYKL